MKVKDSKAILDAMSDEERITTQRIVDKAVRSARDTGHCDTFNRMLGQILPAFVIDGFNSYGETSRRQAFDSDGVSCTGANLTRPAAAYDDDGYDQRGYDRDGFNRQGYNSDGYDAEGWSLSSNAEGFCRTGYRYSGTEVYRNGRYLYIYPDQDGNHRPGRPATEAELAGEAEPPFNPTTYAPDGHPSAFEADAVTVAA